MGFLFELPRSGRRESRLGLDRVRSTVERIEKKVAAGEASSAELERLASLRRRLAADERNAEGEWQKTFGK